MRPPLAASSCVIRKEKFYSLYYYCINHAYNSRHESGARVRRVRGPVRAAGAAGLAGSPHTREGCAVGVACAVCAVAVGKVDAPIHTSRNGEMACERAGTWTSRAQPPHEDAKTSSCLSNHALWKRGAITIGVLSPLSRCMKTPRPPLPIEPYGFMEEGGEN